VIRPGDVQRMSAGTGVRHSEFNASDSEPVHFLQIWIIPEKRGIAPSYEQKSFAASEKQGRLRLIGSRDGRNGSLTIHQDVDLYATELSDGDRVTHALGNGRGLWVQVVRGKISVNGRELKAGDGLAVTETAEASLVSLSSSEVLLFDLALNATLA
jgi:redox-sensitive bicupin YhaK (pirin superfamily)